MTRRGNRLFYIVCALLAALLVLAVFAPAIAPHDPNALGVPYQRASRQHLLGTNDLGQDILSEMIFGTRITLVVGVVSALVTVLVGAALGLFAGYYGGAVDKIVLQLTNIVQSLPSLVLSVLLMAFLDANLCSIILAICITAWAGTARIVRVQVMQLKQQPFIYAEKMLSASGPYIMLRHILPNILNVVFARGVLAVANAMLSEASLSFLGLGAVGQKSWGQILHYAFFRNGIINGYWWWYGPPIAMIMLSVTGFMLLGHSLTISGEDAGRKAVS